MAVPDMLQLAGTGMAHGLAKLWTNPAFVDWAAGYSKVAANGNATAVSRHIARLDRLAAGDPSLRQPIATLQSQLMASLSAAGGSTRDPGTQRR